MTAKCKKCSAELAAKDKFCGDCGLPVETDDFGPPVETGDAPANVAPSAMVPPPYPSEEPPAPPTAKRSGIVILSILAGMILGGGVAAAGVGYYTGWFDSGGETADTKPDVASVKPAEKVKTKTPPKSADLLEPEAVKAEVPTVFLKPGKWVFKSEVTSALLEGTTIPARPNGRNLLGHTNTSTICISEKWAKNPTKGMIHSELGRDCRHGKATMANGKYEATMTCAQPPDGPGYKIRLLGDYDETNINMTTFATVRIGQGVNEIDGKANAALVALLNGQYAGPCK